MALMPSCMQLSMFSYLASEAMFVLLQQVL
ncbi:hypothetical protein RJ639_023042 [Escallonia herrerae]|uniref:Uncharacterized protein n=1 Tax=Escallonia herrerae TaxID=1293975 RepID=A0AA88V0H3_9ASTE|nr:hypothetical protein RJ639_023042 [Escallonia herrerae]